MKCLADGKLQQPAGELEKAFTDSKLKRNKSVPRLVADGTGGVWMLCRHHPLPGQAGRSLGQLGLPLRRQEMAHRQAARRVRQPDGQPPGLVPYLKGVLAVYSGDNRTSTQTRGQDDLFAAFLNPSGPCVRHGVGGSGADRRQPKLAPVHPNEAADIARMREYRIGSGRQETPAPPRRVPPPHRVFGSHSDGDGLLEDAWRYALDAGEHGLDG